MVSELKTIGVRRRTPEVEMVWFDGENAIEVARWLIGQGKAAVDVTFRQGTETLSINGYRIDVPNGEAGVWLDPTGNGRSQDEVVNHFDFLSGSV